jgi:hypothetical protein
MRFDLLILRDRSDQFGVIPAEAPRPRAGIHNPTPVVMDAGFAASLRYGAPRNDDST